MTPSPGCWSASSSVWPASAVVPDGPILIYLFHFKAKIAVRLDLTYAAVARVFGSWQHHHGYVNVRLVLQMAINSVFSSLLGIWLLHLVESTAAPAESRISNMLGFVLILVC